jgi:hypothetical protein
MDRRPRVQHDPAPADLRTIPPAAFRTDGRGSVEHTPAPLSIDGVLDLYFGGSMEAAYAMSGQVAGRINDVLPVRQILEETWRDCQARLRELGTWASS